MSQIFISYVEEDSSVARELAEGLERSGYPTWCYERDGLPGVSYLIQTGKVINDCQAVVLLVSPSSLGSHQVSREVERAHECGKPFVPIMRGISHAEFALRQPMWRQALGTHTSIELPQGGVPSILPRIVNGLREMGIHPADEAAVIELEVKRAREESSKVERILQVLGGRVGVEGSRVFVFGVKPSVKGIYGREKLADECVEIIASGKCEFLSLHGSGGIGKSTLAALVFSRFAEHGEGEFQRFIWYNLGEDAEPETVLLQLVTVVTDGGFVVSGPDRPPFDMLLDLLRMRVATRPTLVVFDNLDNAFDPAAEAGAFSDDRWPQLLRAFLGGKSAVIVASEQVPRFHDPGAEFRRVNGIACEESLKLLREAGLKDNDKVLTEAHELLQGHPMALSAVAAAVMRRPSYGGRLARAGDIMEAVRRCPDQSRNPVVLFDKVVDPDRLPENEYAIITAMPVLLRAETAEAIAALRPEIGLDDVAAALDELYLRSLILMDMDADPPLYSLLALVNEVATSRMGDPQLLHERCYDYYVSLPWDRKTKNPSDVEHLRLAAFHALSLKDLERCRSVLYEGPCLADILQGWGRYDLAYPVHRQELEVAREVGGDEDRMRASRFVSRCQTSLGNCSEALVHAEEALELAVACRDRVCEGICRGQIARIHYRTGDFDNSLKWLQQALELTTETGDRRREGLCRGLIGQITQKKGKFDDALQWLEEAHAVAREVGDRSSEVEWRGSIGLIHYLRGDYDRASDVLTPALQIAIDNGDKISESRLSALIGQVHKGRGDFDGAVSRFEQALEVDREICNRRHEGTALAVLGVVHGCRGEHEKALKLLEESVRIADEIRSRAAVAFRRGQIGEVYLETGELDKAFEHFEEALLFTIETGNKTNELVWRGRIGEVHLKRGDYEKALEWLEEALSLALEVEDKENESEWKGRIGLVHLELGYLEKAGEWLEEALRLALEIRDPVIERAHRVNLAKLAMATGKPTEALEHLERVKEIAEKLGMVQRFMEEIEASLDEAKAACAAEEQL